MAVFDFVTLTDLFQVLRRPSSHGGGILDLVMTNVPDLCQVSVGTSGGRCDHSPKQQSNVDTT